MDDMMNKIGEILSDPESLKQITELAQMFMSGKVSDENDADSDQTENKEEKSDDKAESSSSENADSIFSGFDFSKLMKIQEIMGAVSGNDKNSELLLALKPHLSEEKQKKVDKAIKLMKIIAVWNIIKDSGMLKDFLS